MHVDCWLVDHDIERDTETQKGKGSFNLTKPIITLGSFFCYFQAPDCFQWDLPALSKATVLPASGRIRRGTWRNASLGAIPPLFGGNRATRTKTYHANFLVGNLEMLFPITPKKMVSPNLGQISMKTGKNGFVKKKWDTSGRKRKTKHDFNCWFTHVSTFNWKLPDKKIANKFQGPCDLRIAVTSSLWPLLAYMWTQKSENDQIQHFQQFHDSKGLVAQVVFTITLFEILKLI